MSLKIPCQLVLWHVCVQKELYFLTVATAKGVISHINLYFILEEGSFIHLKRFFTSYSRIQKYFLVEVKPECYVDDDCPTSDICNKGSCVDACRLSHCGSNAICEAGFHSAKCVCLPGYTGDARTACNKCKLNTNLEYSLYVLA